LKNDNIIIKDIKDYPPIVLAYLGDAVFELLVRTSMVTGENVKSKRSISILSRLLMPRAGESAPGSV
jgi:23S rRNA maturation mini-RNase III